MTGLLFDVGVFGLLTSSLFTLLAMAGLLYHFDTSRPRRGSAGTPEAEDRYEIPVTLLKPLDGAEPDIEKNLESFFRQDYSRFEILFCARSIGDPALAAARRVAARYPSVPARFFATGEPAWINAKVASLEAMASAAAHDIFIISDSDVRVSPAYIREVVTPFRDAQVGAVTCLYRGVSGRGFWSQLEAAGMSVEMTAGVLTANLLEGMKFALGPTMAVRRGCVDQMGGFSVLGPYCSDDFLLGAKVAAQGKTVVLSRHVIDHIVLNRTCAASLLHQTRWMKSTRFSRPMGHLGTAMTFSVPFGMITCCTAFAMGHPLVGLSLLGYSIGNRLLLALVCAGGAVRERHLLRTVILFPLRDIVGFCCWVASYGSSEILWRGRRYRLSRGGRMHPAPMEAAESPEQVLTT